MNEKGMSILVSPAPPSVIRAEAGNIGYATNATFLSDAAGCVTNISHTGTGGYSDSMELKWDERYRLQKVSLAEAQSTQSVEYAYDVLGGKVSRTAGILPAEVEYYVYDGQQVVADLDGAGNLLHTYVWGTGIDNLMSFTDHTTTNTYYPIKDLQNTVITLVNESGSVVETYDYDAWGRTKVFSASGAELPMSGIGNRYCFQGREIEWQTGLYYFRARWYNPETGRWLSKDPIGISGGLNLYEFCGSNPVNYSDPFGLEWEAEITNVANTFVDPNGSRDTVTWFGTYTNTDSGGVVGPEKLTTWEGEYSSFTYGQDGARVIGGVNFIKEQIKKKQYSNLANLLAQNRVDELNKKEKQE